MYKQGEPQYVGYTVPVAGVNPTGMAQSIAVDNNGKVLLAPGSTVTTTPAPAGTASVTAVTVSTAAVLLKAANANRLGMLITNNGTGNLFIGTSNAVTSSGAAMGLMLQPGGSYQDSGDGVYTGDLWGIYDATASSQNVSVREVTT